MINRLHGMISFTLIELLMVVAVIMMLAALLMPALQKAKVTARRIGCASNLKNLTLGIHCYAGDWSGYVPQRPANSDYQCWDMKIADYINYRMTGNRNTWGPPIFHCPAGEPTPYYALGSSRGYAMNSIPSLPDPGTSYFPRQNKIGGNPDNGKIYLLIDIWIDLLANMPEHYTIGYPTNYEYMDLASLSRLAFRHGKSLNFSRMDGSVDNTTRGQYGAGEKNLWFFYGSSSPYAYWLNGLVPK